MKELTTEEKAKRYDEAIEVARKIKNGEPIDVPDGTLIPVAIFPELNESEDEEIRKELIDIVKKSPITFAFKDKWKVLDWLEKQEPIDKNKFAKGTLKGIALSIMQWLDANCADGNMCLSNMECEDIENSVVNADWSKVYAYMKKKLEKQDEQNWSEEDSRILYNVKAYIGYAAGQLGVKDELFKEANEWLNSLPIGFIHNKNYNEDMVTLLVGELERIANYNNAPEQYQAEINWLKSLRP